MKLFTEDLDRDCSGLSLRAFGAWMRIIMDLRNHGGTRTLTLEQWAGVCRTTIDETRLAIDELLEQEICDSSVTQALRSNALSQKNNGRITLVSRRIFRESKSASHNNLRQQRFREKRKSNGCVTQKVTLIDTDTEADTDTEGEDVCVSSSGRRPVQETSRTNEQRPHTHAPPSDFVLTKELRDFVEQASSDLDPETEFEKCRDHYAVLGTTPSSWDAAFRKWIRIAVERQKRTPVRRESVEENNRRVLSELEAGGGGHS